MTDGQTNAVTHSRLRVTEIFLSLQGESASAGLPTVFVRLTGCPLRCGYCDTEYAFHGGRWMAIDEIVREVAKYNVTHVTVTGGEPLAQKPCATLLARLCDLGYRTSLETSGAMDVSDVDARVIKVMDLKTPGSGEMHRNRYENLSHLCVRDEIKFVICDRVDYDWAKEKVDEFQLQGKCEILFSPCYERLPPRQLADWIVEDRLPVRFQIQLHKIIWGEEPGR
jgi:7-carboxy-7-deazaguanine synthase